MSVAAPHQLSMSRTYRRHPRPVTHHFCAPSPRVTGTAATCTRCTTRAPTPARSRVSPRTPWSTSSTSRARCRRCCSAPRSEFADVPMAIRRLHVSGHSFAGIRFHQLQLNSSSTPPHPLHIQNRVLVPHGAHAHGRRPGPRRLRGARRRQRRPLPSPVSTAVGARKGLEPRDACRRDGCQWWCVSY